MRDLTEHRARVIIIDDELFKARDIEETLKRILNNPMIVRETNRADGLLAIRNANKAGTPFDIIITDNYMPLCNDDKQLEPCGTGIVLEIERLGIDCKKIICSSGTVDDVDADYSVVRYNSSVLLDDKLKSVLRL